MSKITIVKDYLLVNFGNPRQHGKVYWLPEEKT